MYNIGVAARLSYVHTPLRSDRLLDAPHRGSRSVSDIDFEAFLAFGAGERPRASLPPLPTLRVELDDCGDGEGLRAAAALLRGTRGPCLLVLVFSYQLLNSPFALATLARHLAVNSSDEPGRERSARQASDARLAA